MLAVNQLSGFGIKSGGFQTRFMGGFASNFAASTTATATINSSDLGLALGSQKQILVATQVKNAVATGVTINGVAAGNIMSGGGNAQLWSAVYAGSGPFNIVVTAAGSITENTNVLVWEVNEAAPLYEATRGMGFIPPASASLRQATNSIVIAVGTSATDTNAFTWVNQTEIFDADVGDDRMSAAQNLSVVSARQATAVTTSAPASGALLSIAPCALSANIGVRGGAQGFDSVAGSGSTATFTTRTNFNNMGNPELVIAVGLEANVTITGVTFNGVAMTSRGSIVNTAATPDLIIHFFSISLTNGSASGNIVVTASASIAGLACAIMKWLLYGVNSYGTIQTAQGNSTGTTVSPSINADGAVLFACDTNIGNGITVSGCDQLFDINLGANEFAAGNIINDTSGTKVVGASFLSDQFAMAALPINP